jgi:hypothetical protein
MRPCQKKHFLRKIDSYQDSINRCYINIKEQKKRVDCFQGLINQLRAVLDDKDDTSQNKTDNRKRDGL